MSNKTVSGIGYSPLTERVYMGRKNELKRMWVGEKKDVTNEFIDCAFQYFEKNTIRTITDGKTPHLFIHVEKNNADIDKVIKKLKSLKNKTNA